jgi:hypothetical protein
VKNLKNETLTNKKGAAYFEPCKYKIEQTNKGDSVFLYRSGVDIIAKGIGSGVIDKLPDCGQEKCATQRTKFKKLPKSIRTSEIKKTSGVNYVFMQTMFSIDKVTRGKLWKME